jgi:hypothetical protein
MGEKFLVTRRARLLFVWLVAVIIFAALQTLIIGLAFSYGPRALLSQENYYATHHLPDWWVITAQVVFAVEILIIGMAILGFAFCGLGFLLFFLFFPGNRDASGTTLRVLLPRYDAFMNKFGRGFVYILSGLLWPLRFGTDAVRDWVDDGS